MRKTIISLSIFVFLILVGIGSFIILSKKQFKLRDKIFLTSEEETARPFLTIEKDTQGSVERIRGIIEEIYPNKILINYGDNTTVVVIDPNRTVSWKTKFQPSENNPERITSRSELENLLKIGKFVETKTNEKIVDGENTLVAHYLIIWE